MIERTSYAGNNLIAYARLFLREVGRGLCSLLVKERYSKGTIRFLLKELTGICVHPVNAYRSYSNEYLIKFL
ncbi:MAG: hypothetical protein E6929_03215 [Clostridium sp.]|nr:hypothetical protein [Clostridium sp.]